METKITIEELAEKLRKTVYNKGASGKRIYMNQIGFNTKKMRTTTYIYESNGEFKVSCFIDCPSQSKNWIDNQKEEVIELVENKIKIAIYGDEENQEG